MVDYKLLTQFSLIIASMESDPFPNIDVDIQNENQLIQPQQKDLSSLMTVSVQALLDKLKMPSLNQYCNVCLRLFTTTLSAMKCTHCSRMSHSRCSNLKAGKTSLKCKICENPSKCLECDDVIDNSSNNISCSMCWRAVHPECYSLPLQLFGISRPYFMKIYGRFAEINKFVCFNCQLNSSGLKIAEIATLKNCKYYLMKLKGPSPIHYTWKSEKQLNFHHESMDEEYSLAEEEEEPHIENILSIYVPQTISFALTLKDLFERLKERKNCLNPTERVKFLVKWQNVFRLSWQDEEIVCPYIQLLRPFFFRLEVNYIMAHMWTHPEFVLDSEICNLFEKEKDIKKLTFIGTSSFENEKKSKIGKVMCKVYQNYQCRIGQSLKSKNENDETKAKVIGFLMNTIFFFQKRLQPVLIFAEGQKVKWWTTHLKRICPYHIVMVLGRSEGAIQTLCNKHLFVLKRKNRLPNFNILIIEFEKVDFIDKLINLKIIIEQSALLVMDQKITNTCKKLYEAARIPKIKIGQRETSDSGSMNSLKVTNHSFVNSLSDTKQKSGERAIILESGNEKQFHKSLPCSQKGLTKSPQPLSEVSFRQDQSLIKRTLVWLKMDLVNLIKNKKLFEIRSPFDQLQRAVYLRYIMTFGLNFQSLEQLAAGLRYLQGSFFSNWEFSKIQAALYNYTKQFMSIVYTFSQQENLSNHELQLHYLLGLDVIQVSIQAKEVLKRISLLYLMKRFYKSESDESRIQKMKMFGTNGEGREKNPEYLDLMICQAILNRGFGRWESISEYSRSWESGSQAMSLRRHICKKAGLQDITISMFSYFVKMRVGHIVSILQLTMEQE